MKGHSIWRGSIVWLLVVICAVVSRVPLQASDSTPPQVQLPAAADQTTESEAVAPVEKQQYIRLQSEKKTPRSLQTAIVRFASEDASSPTVTVDLIGAIHVADAAYYDQLNQRFQQYDAVLYELVADADSNVPRPGETRSNHPISAMQRAMKNLLELEFQLDRIDYTAANMVHADMSPEQFAQSMRERNESFLKMFMQMISQAMAKQSTGSGASDLDLLVAFFHKNRPLALKRILAQELEDVDSSLDFLSGPNGSTIVTERNKVALNVLQERLEKGDKKIAIFYGAGHLSDFAQRLQDDFGLIPVKTTWLQAWDLTGESN